MELISLVKQMRHLQRLYFRYRDKEVLKKAKQLEQKVDAMIKQLEETQTNLFQK